MPTAFLAAVLRAYIFALEPCFTLINLVLACFTLFSSQSGQVPGLTALTVLTGLAKTFALQSPQKRTVTAIPAMERGDLVGMNFELVHGFLVHGITLPEIP